MCQTTPDFRRGDVCPEIVLMGACPGQEEEGNGRPFIGRAGEHLESMMGQIHRQHGNEFPCGQRDGYTLMNAHDAPRYRGQDGFRRTQPTNGEVCAEENIQRIIRQLQCVGATTVLFFGRKARLLHPLLNAENLGVQYFSCGHPSPIAWNTRAAGDSPEEKLTNWVEDTFRSL